MHRAAWMFGAVLSLAGCSRPSPAPSAPVNPSTIWAEMVDAGCIRDSPDGPEAVAEELSSDAGARDWLRCLQAGGSVASCAVPCSPPASAPSYRVALDGGAHRPIGGAW